jgi:hypothetical protein
MNKFVITLAAFVSLGLAIPAFAQAMPSGRTMMMRGSGRRW